MNKYMKKIKLKGKKKEGNRPLRNKKKRNTEECVSLFRASCRIRTNDPEITNHVLWPTELKRQTGKRSTSHRYDLLPLLRSNPGGVQRELVV